MYHYFAEALRNEQKLLNRANRKGPARNHDNTVLAVKENQGLQGKHNPPRQSTSRTHLQEKSNSQEEKQIQDQPLIKQNKKEMQKGMQKDMPPSKPKSQRDQLPERPIQTIQEKPINEPKPPKAQEPLTEFAEAPLKLIACPEGCGRSFNEKALQKHIKVCKKVFLEQRKVFDSKNQREMNEDVVVAPPPKKQKQDKKKDQKKKDWKKESEAFRLMIQSAKNPDAKLSEEEQKLIRDAQTSDLVPCEFCGRKFNEKAAEKHIPFCRQQQMKKKK